MSHDSQSPTLRTRLAHEFREYVFVVIYLYICLGTVLLYRATLLDHDGLGFTLHGLAAIKALVLGKFLLLGQAARVGQRLARRPLAQAILGDAAFLFLVLVALTIAEEVIVGAVHGVGARDALREFGSGRWREVAAGCLLLWLILLPYCAMRQVRLVLGDVAWRRLLAGQSG